MEAPYRLSRRSFLNRSTKLAGAGLAFTNAFASLKLNATEDGRWLIGCYTRPWGRYDYRVAFDAIAEAGFEYVGLMRAKTKTGRVISVSTEVEEAHRAGEEARKRGLKIPSVYGGGIPVARSLKAGIAGLRRLIDNCEACNAGNLLMGGTGSRKLYERYYKAISECCDYAAEKGIGISIKPHGGLNATGPQCRKAVEMVNHSNFRIWYDPGNILYYSNGKLDPVEDAASVDGLVAGMCIKDYRHPKNVMITPGTGQVDFPAVLARLRKGGFTGGPLIIECLDAGNCKHTLEEAKKARVFVREVVNRKPEEGKQTKAQTLKAGIAKVDITPPAGYRMSGYFRERSSTGTLNPLYAKAVVFNHGKTAAAMVFCDLIGVSLDVSKEARRRASQLTGIPSSSILVCATHTHTGPLYCGALRKYFHKRAVAKHGGDPHEKVDYPAELVDRIVEAVEKANNTLQPVELKQAVSGRNDISFNRRFHMKDGSVRFNPGIKNPGIVKPAGPIDPELSTVFLHGADGTPIGAIVNFALHLDTTGGTKYAADYPYYLEQKLKQKYGPQLTVLFGSGACGDINHIDVTKRKRLTPESIGRKLAQTVTGSDPVSVDPLCLSVARRIVKVPLQRFRPGEIEWAEDNIEKVGTGKLPFLKQVRAYKTLAVRMREGDTIPLEVQVFKLGRDLALVGLPGEVFVELGLAIKKASPFASTMVVELSNDCPGYVPTEKAFEEGSYETVNSRIKSGGGEELVRTAVELLKSLHSSNGGKTKQSRRA